MAPSHWLTTAGSSANYTSGNSLPSLSVTVPAGGRMAKWIYDCYLFGHNVGTNPLLLSPLYHYWKITINSTQYPSRMIHETYRRVPFELNNHQNGTQITSIMSIWHNGGSKELGGDQEVSYGGLGKGAITVTHGGNFALGIAGSELQGSLNYYRQLRVLYFL